MADKKYYDANGKMVHRVRAGEKEKKNKDTLATTRSGAEECALPQDGNLLIGRNPVMEALKSGRTVDKLMMLRDGEGSIKKIAGMARDSRIQVQYVERQVLDRIAGGGNHQGVVAYVSAYSYCELDDLIQIARQRHEDPFFILLDGVEDPHNLGAIMRTANAVGAHGIVIPNRRSASLNETVAKASAGAIEYVPVAKVSNLVQAIERLKEQGMWIAACDMDGETYYQAKLTGGIALVVGGEGNGVGRLVREHCDFILSIPMKGQINSLNASNAAAILMYEIFQQREGAMTP